MDSEKDLRKLSTQNEVAHKRPLFVALTLSVSLDRWKGRWTGNFRNKTSEEILIQCNVDTHVPDFIKLDEALLGGAWLVLSEKKELENLCGTLDCQWNWEVG